MDALDHSTIPPTPTATRAGHVALVGKPNAGKSTLLNRLLGLKLAITSPKPQSTRVSAVGIVSTDDCQMILLDTPGLLDPSYTLQRSMLASAIASLRDADVAVYVHDATNGPPPALETLLPPGTPLPARRVTFANKGDLLNDGNRATLEAIPGVVVGSAEHGDGVDRLLAQVADMLPLSPFLYPADELSTQPVRFFAAEAIRESALAILHEEVPYGIFVDIEEFRENRKPHYIRAVLYVERDSQKGIVLGAKGRTIREIGTASRILIEKLVETAVYLDLWVKVMPDWRKDAVALRRFGFTVPHEGGA
ncbi:MAG: GTPase Era [Gemmatimonadaceae bacterium]|nr:GTPase Era [Gemmatimonadaceae bacterium]